MVPVTYDSIARLNIMHTLTDVKDDTDIAIA